MGFVLSPLAQADIEDIWNYTRDRWGLEQAERYVGLLRHDQFRGGQPRARPAL